PNKKLHFEVAIIKAIQSLGQATLDEVIENLNALRVGKAAAAIAEASRKESPARKIGTIDPRSQKSETPHVSESPGANNAAESPADIDPAMVWEQLAAKIP